MTRQTKITQIALSVMFGVLMSFGFYHELQVSHYGTLALFAIAIVLSVTLIILTLKQKEIGENEWS